MRARYYPVTGDSFLKSYEIFRTSARWRMVHAQAGLAAARVTDSGGMTTLGESMKQGPDGRFNYLPVSNYIRKQLWGYAGREDNSYDFP
jgi:hypothetical protein